MTPYRAGEVVHFVFKEIIAHGGHYRIALGLTGEGDIPADPPVTARAGISISAPIEEPPQFPVLADGIHRHDGAPPAEWTFDVRLPANVTCDSCLLQITQFMTDHGSNTGQNDGFSITTAPPSRSPRPTRRMGARQPPTLLKRRMRAQTPGRRPAVDPVAAASPGRPAAPRDCC